MVSVKKNEIRFWMRKQKRSHSKDELELIGILKGAIIYA
jgi:hypothetical protein